MRERLLNNRYRLDERIGEGGMGQVWRAQDGELGRTVAVKVFKPSGTADDSADERDELLARFRQEARTAATLDSPRIIAIHDYGTDRGVPYLVMALVNGQSLEEILRAEGRLPLERTLRWAEQICEALAVAHDAGVVHRDIKPGNVMIGDDGWVKVLDFGIAKFLDGDDSSNRLTRTGAIPIGSVLYMAPEQFRQETVDGRLDLYALGCVLYELLVGRPPYTGPAAGVMYNHLHDTPLRPSLARPELTRAVDQLILSLMTKERAGRPADAQVAAERISAVRTALTTAEDGGEVGAPSGTAGANSASGTGSSGPPKATPPHIRGDAKPERAAPAPPVASAAPALPGYSVEELLERKKPAGELVKPAKSSLAELAQAAGSSQAVEAQVSEDRVPEDAAVQPGPTRSTQLRRKPAVLAVVAAFTGISVVGTVLVGVGVFSKEDTYQIGVTSERVHKAMEHVLDTSHLDADRFDLVEVRDTSSWEAVSKRHPDLVALVGSPKTAKPSRILPVLRARPSESNERSRDRAVVHNTDEQADRLLRYLGAEHDLTRLLVFDHEDGHSDDLGRALSAGVQRDGGEITRAVHVGGLEDGTVDRAYVRELVRGEDAPDVAVLPGGGQGYGAAELREDGYEGLVVSAESPSPTALDRTGFEEPTKLPEDVVRVRAYANPANSPTCDSREAWCAGRGVLPSAPGAWEEYDAARALATALSEIDLDETPPLARDQLDTALAQVKAEGLLGPVDFGRNGSFDNSAYGRPIWLDRTENGRWKEAELLR